ncbi:Leucyl/phenylalanyl-tRNA--protein transferase [Bathymodiolus thermophilus thioautotrophic gill symbiont]|uniref:Leucyl/phenylalanyl-tRNA--protein transferase n=1 Tax=Bathymodiolus thermophilus thioautotrophic gill symbiont TaxID=2360 RepID=A0A8H9CG91_9GAMM|nr:leucyl/phenylalanyl-tRNA--protein transferase [Bathymodiolus thermophilus thioautotrophic gill symbiont]CAB5497031.1 Leucyl/phenylalanyl-tRNA--protein transferase (EC [Bathymodiolus thermophilus thioautotrophic gill symbiont]SGZ98518.1 Leucyl/phenylalanyl-tRNA--protein transferase [Bathymodiolus thermophilus thioautotrophic gill symbiont]
MLKINIPEAFILYTPNTPFPQVELALEEPNGLIAIGGDLSPNRLISAYQQGIFPWYSENDPVLWYCPNPRMVITPETLHISKSLRKTLRTNQFTLKTNSNFERVIHHCKSIKRKGQDSTWIDKAMVQAYTELHAQGVVQSVEVYQNTELVGGLYGVRMGKVFFGESMFSLVSNASKIAFVHLVQNMGYELVDCQVQNPHLQSLGAFNLPRDAFIQRLDELLLK